MNNHREDRIRKLVTGLYGMRDKFQCRTSCTVECDAFHLGRLLIDMKQFNLDPGPDEPYNGISICEIRRVVSEFSTATQMSKVYRTCHEGQKWNDRNACRVGNALKTIFDIAKLEYNLGIELGQGSNRS